jgi:hypothetical protein
MYVPGGCFFGSLQYNAGAFRKVNDLRRTVLGEIVEQCSHLLPLS